MAKMQPVFVRKQAMPQGPTIEHDGRTYERYQGGWLELGTNMRAATALSQELDRLAQRNHDLWNSCRAHDAKQHLRRGGIGGRSKSGHALSAEFFGESRQIRLTADIALGWRFTGANWRYSDQQVMDLQRGGWALRCTAEFVEDTKNFPKYENNVGWHQTDGGFEIDPEWLNNTSSSAFPSFSLFEDREREIAFSVRDSKAVFEIPIFSDEEMGTLNPHLHWRHVNGLWVFGDVRGGIYARPQPIPQNVVSRAFRFRLTAVLHKPSREPVRPTWEHGQRFASAGLPSLGKRR